MMTEIIAKVRPDLIRENNPPLRSTFQLYEDRFHMTEKSKQKQKCLLPQINNLITANNFYSDFYLIFFVKYTTKGIKF